MHTHRFGRKIKLPATIAIKHQIRVLMAQDEFKKAESELVEPSMQRAARDATLPRVEFIGEINDCATSDNRSIDAAA